MRGSCLAVLIAALFLMSCCSGTDPGDGVPHDQDSVLGTLYLFQDVWNDGDLDTYEGLLDEDTFTFYFDPEDVDYGLPFSWGYEDEIEAYTNLFDAIGAENIDVQLNLDEVTEPEEGTNTCLVVDVPYAVSLKVEDSTYQAFGNLDMQLEKTGGQWYITDWWDFAPSLLSGLPTTWGMLKYFI